MNSCFLEGLLTLNNEYQGLGLTATVMSSGLDFVSQNTLVNHAGLFKKLIEFNGTADKAQAMAQIAESGHYRIDQLDMAERLWMGENDARQRAYVNNWRQAKWAKQDAFEKLKREMKEARDKANKEWFEQNYGHPGSHGGVASVTGTFTNSPVNGKNGIGVNIGGGIGLMAQAVEINAGVYVNSNGIGQAYFSIGNSVDMPVYLNGGASAQLMYIHTDADKIDLSGSGNTIGLGYGLAAGSYGYSINDAGKKTSTYGAGVGAGIKVSGGYTKTNTWTTQFILWLPSMMLHL